MNVISTEFNWKVKLTDEEFNVLNKIATNTKMDCWFFLINEGEEDVIFDLEKDRVINFADGLENLFEGVDGLDYRDDVGLTDDEIKVFLKLIGELSVIETEEEK